MNRFGFSKARIYTLFDSAVTRRDVLPLLNSVLRKTGKGDAFVFYSEEAMQKNRLFFYHPPVAKLPLRLFSASALPASELAVGGQSIAAFSKRLYDLTAQTLHDDASGGFWLNGEEGKCRLVLFSQLNGHGTETFSWQNKLSKSICMSAVFF